MTNTSMNRPLGLAMNVVQLDQDKLKQVPGQSQTVSLVCQNSSAQTKLDEITHGPVARDEAIPPWIVPSAVLLPPSQERD